MEASQKEALLNELKGNLFEYLVGQSLASNMDVLPTFYQNFGGEIKNKLVEYEKWLLKNDSLLYKKLPDLAAKMSEKLIPLLPKKIDNLMVVGKAGGGGHHHGLNEADLVVIKDKTIIPLSVKLCKSGAFVNTKSGGVKSFIGKYFHQLEKAPNFQKKLNETLNLSFKSMGHELYRKCGKEFKGQFDESWEYSHLPGQVPDEMKTIIRKFYSEVIYKIYEIFKEMNESSPEKFKAALYPILGFGNQEIIQATCFHGTKKGEKYHLKGVRVFTGPQMESNLKKIKLEKYQNDLSSFEITAGSITLQIRVKPMNVFTTPAVKINCSIRESGK